MKKRSSLWIFFFLIVVSGHAQELGVTGTVIAASDKQPMPFVTIAVKGNTNAVTTDMDGKYSIQHLSQNDTLVFSFVGYTPQYVKVGSQQVINITLSSSTKELDEVVVTALGVNRQKRELGYSTEKINGDELRESNTPNILNAMTGKAAGVQITNPDGVDGGTTRIVIRGNNSIDGNNQPLIIVDGVYLNNEPGLTDVGRGKDWGSEINNINMEDVENINILKGGTAAALYGARGANGVVLITMKKGKKQKGIGLSYNMTYRVSQPYRYRDVQNVYGGGAPSVDNTMPTLSYDTNGIASLPSLSTDPVFGYPGSAVSWGPKMEGQPIHWWDGTTRTWSPQPDNIKLPYKDGINVMHNISAEGGGDIGTMRFSVTHVENSPIVHNSNFKQLTINTNSTLKVSDKVNLNISASYMDYHRLNSPLLGEDPQSFNKGQLYSWPRNYQGEDFENYALADGTRNPQTGYPYLYVDPYLWWKYYNNNTNLDRSKLLGGISLYYEITPWLNFTGRTGIDYTTDQTQEKHKPTDLIGLNEGYYGESSGRDRSINNEFLFSATKKNIFHSDFNVTLNAGGSQWIRNYNTMSAHSGTWYFPNWYSIQNFTSQNFSDTTQIYDSPASLEAKTYVSKRKLNSLYGFLNLSYKNYLFVELTGRNDWASTLPPEANSYFFPGINAGFIATDAFDMKADWLNYWKLRAGASQTATDAAVYQTGFYYNTGLFGGEQSSTFPTTIPPAGLKPQRTNTYEIGTILGFFNDRYTVDFTYYYKYCFDQIIGLRVPTSSGAPNVVINNGVVTNKGIEIILNATLIQKKNFVLKTGLNFSSNRNTIVSLGDDNAPIPKADIWGENGPKIELHPGDDWGTIIGWDYVYKDGQRVVNADGTNYKFTDTQVPIGNASPDFLAGWTAEVQYKNFVLRTLIDTKWGGDIYCGSYVIGLQTGQSPETLTERDGGGLPYTDNAGNTGNTGVILEGVHEDGSPNTTVVPYYYKYMPNAGGWGHFLSKPGIVEDTWVKFREINLTYTLSQKLVRKLKIFQELSVSVTGRDLFYLYTTVPDHINPEGTMGAGDVSAFEWGSLPGVRSFSFGINARF